MFLFFLGVNGSLHVDSTVFSVFGFLWYCVDVLIYGGIVCLPKYYFFKMLYVSGIVSYVKFTFPDCFLIHVILSRVISLYVEIFVKCFVWEFLQRMFYLYNMYHVQCVYFSGIQESMICVVDRNQILCDVTCSDHIVHQTCMVLGLQLQY